MIRWEERQGVIDRLQEMADNPNQHGMTAGGIVDVLRNQATLAQGLLLLLNPPSPFDQGEAPTVGEFDIPGGSVRQKGHETGTEDESTN